MNHGKEKKESFYLQIQNTLGVPQVIGTWKRIGALQLLLGQPRVDYYHPQKSRLPKAQAIKAFFTATNHMQIHGPTSIRPDLGYRIPGLACTRPHSNAETLGPTVYYHLHFPIFNNTCTINLRTAGEAMLPNSRFLAAPDSTTNQKPSCLIVTCAIEFRDGRPLQPSTR